MLEQEKAWRRAIQRDQKRFNSRVEALKSAIQNGDTIQSDGHRSWLLKSPSAKRVAIAQLLRAKKPLKLESYQDVKALVASVTVFAPMDEPVKVFAKEKTSKNGYRAIFSFDDRQRVAQRVMANVLNAHFSKRNFQYFDEGVPKAILSVLTAIEDGNVWLAHLDIKDFYPSFELKEMTDFLPLPQAVVEAALTGRNMVLKCASYTLGVTPLHFIEEARRGLPQGASSSPAVSHLCVSQLAVDVATLEHLFNYEDDFLLLAGSKAELESRIASLKTAVGKLPGGQFHICTKSIGHASIGLDFLGHHIVYRNSQALAEPSLTNTLRLMSMLQSIDEEYGAFSGGSGKIPKGPLLHSCADKFSLLSHWKAAFRACDPKTEGWQSIVAIEDEVHTDLQKQGLTLANLPKPSKSAVQKVRKPYHYNWSD